MSNLLHKELCLKLNRLWFGLEFITVKDAFSEICSISPRTGKPPQMAIDVIYETNPDGTHNIDAVPIYRPVSVEEWFTLPVRDCDLSIQCGNRLVRVPTITICTNFDKTKEYKPKFSSEGVRQRDGDRCVVTKRLLAPGEGDLGHDIAKAKGGRRTWTNVGYIDKKLNRLMGTKSFKEMGWSHVKLEEPKKRVVLLKLDDMRHESQRHLLDKN